MAWFLLPSGFPTEKYTVKPKRAERAYIDARKDVNPVKLEYAEQRMKQRWYELVMAEQRGASEQELENLYATYMQALEEYNRCSQAQARQHTGRKKRSASLVGQKKTA
jgi:hypothetical protein